MSNSPFFEYVLTALYVLYILATLAQIAVLLFNDLKSGKFNLFTILYNAVIGILVVALNYDFQVLVRYFGLSGKSIVGLFLVWAATWALYAWYPRIRRNPFWRAY